MALSALNTIKSLSRAQVRAAWDREYLNRQTLPSTYANGPSRCLAFVADLFERPGPLTVLDIGAGNGRHSKYFALSGAIVHALDISGAAMEICSRNLKLCALDSAVSLYHQSCLDFLPDVEGGFDVVLDSYMSCHITDADERAHFFLKVHKVLSPAGVFISFGVSPNDSYYSRFAGSGVTDGAVVLDSLSEIPKILTSSNHLRREFSGLLEVIRSKDLPMRDRMGSEEFDKAAVITAAGVGSL